MEEEEDKAVSSIDSLSGVSEVSISL